jgi:predicted CoA-binding protein
MSLSTILKNGLTKENKMECEFPTINEPNEEIKKILEECKVIAMPGLSPDESKPSNKVARYLQQAGYKIVPIYPKGDEILGEKVYKSVEEIPFEIDMIDMFRKPEFAFEMIEAIKKRKDVKCLWLQQGIVNNEAAQIARDLGVKVVQNKCTKIEHMALF